jgi:putative PIN family toxin of toxin-antitoxin system
MMQPRVVIDTNCLLQILGAKSKYHFLFESFLQFGYVMCISNEVLLEYEEILRMKASPLAADLFVKVIVRSRNVIRKDPYFKWNIITNDFDDNKFVDCAFACRANYIVTNDNHFQEAANSPFPVFNVINLDDFSELMKQQ